MIYDRKLYDVYVDISNMLKLARKEVKIVDSYVDESVFEMYLINVHPDASIKLITKNIYGKFREVAKRFRIQRPKFENRISDEIHDRYLIVDDKVLIVSQSLKDAEKKPCSIVELNDKDMAFSLFRRLWYTAKKESI